MILRTISCGKKGCTTQYTEACEGAGFAGWGHIDGLANSKGPATAHLCPEHLAEIKKYLNEKGDDNG